MPNPHPDRRRRATLKALLAAACAWGGAPFAAASMRRTAPPDPITCAAYNSPALGARPSRASSAAAFSRVNSPAMRAESSGL